MTQYSNFLSIRHGGKGIPYGGTRGKREDGGENYGFKNLKSSPGLIDSIPELQNDHELRKLIQAINTLDSPFISVGCSSGPVSDDNGYRFAGYVEFAINSESQIFDATNYFPLFFQFDHHLHHSRFQGHVQFNWELMGATFIDKRVDGFTCAVFVNTAYLPSSLEASQAWASALDSLKIFLSSQNYTLNDKIY